MIVIYGCSLKSKSENSYSQRKMEIDKKNTAGETVEKEWEQGCKQNRKKAQMETERTRDQDISIQIGVRHNNTKPKDREEK